MYRRKAARFQHKIGIFLPRSDNSMALRAKAFSKFLAKKVFYRSFLRGSPRPSWSIQNRVEFAPSHFFRLRRTSPQMHLGGLRPAEFKCIPAGVAEQGNLSASTFFSTKALWSAAGRVRPMDEGRMTMAPGFLCGGLCFFAAKFLTG
jgi:hypothetical protein